MQPTGDTTKGFTRGTHRLIAPEDTITKVTRFLPALGITRVADVTGLDTIGLPVVMVVRPNSRSIAVSQGKGLDLAAATASGLMESIESYHAERIRLPLTLAPWSELRLRARVLDVDRLPRSPRSRFHPHLPLLWTQGVNLLDDEPTWVPYETVHTDFRLPQPTGSGCFPCTSNGLASGNHQLEALSHALCEVIERDATTLWRLGGGTTRDDLRLDPSTVDDAACRHVLDLYDAAGVACGIWETTSDIGVPCFWVMIVDREPNPFHPPFAAAGMGCHPAREVALLRALTEAAQGRLTFISGSRDDVSRTEYTTAASPEILGLQAQAVVDGVVSRSFLDVPTFQGATFADDVGHEVRCLATVGITEVVALDLSLPELRIPVARVVVPGLEGPEEKVAGIERGARARALLAPA